MSRSAFDLANAPPDEVNDLGVKWWRVSGDIWLTEQPDGERDYVALYEGEIVTHSKKLDDVAIKLDLYKFSMEWRRRGPDEQGH